MITSAILSGTATLAGLYLIYFHAAVLGRRDVKSLPIVMPVLIGTLAWATACFEFAVLGADDVSIEAQLATIVISWVWLSCIVILKEAKK